MYNGIGLTTPRGRSVSTTNALYSNSTNLQNAVELMDMLSETCLLSGAIKVPKIAQVLGMLHRRSTVNPTKAS